MNKVAVLFCLTSGILFSSYPFLIRKSGADPIVAGFILQIGSMIVFAPSLYGKLTAKNFFVIGALLVLVAGFMNGFGHRTFQKLLAMKDTEMWLITVVMVTTQIITSALLGRALLHEEFPTRKLGWTAVAMICIYNIVKR